MDHRHKVRNISFILQATDQDSGDFGTVHYSLQQRAAKFSIAPDTGIISLVSTYNQTADSKYNLLTVFARDNPMGTESNTANVTVQVCSRCNSIVVIYYIPVVIKLF